MTVFSFDPSTQQLSISIEDGGSQSVSLASLEERLILNGNNLNIIGSSGTAINLSSYLDNTDDQQIVDFSYDSGILTLELENGGTLSVNIQDPEGDPIFTASPAGGITNQDITNWNNDLVDDADTDPTNEIDLTDFGQSASHNHTVSGSNNNVNQGDNVVIEYYVDSTVNAFGFAAGAGTDDQILTFDDVNDQLILEDGGSPVDLSKYNNSNVECQEIEVTTSIITSPVDLPDDITKRSIWINGIRCKEESVLTRIQHVSINSTTNNVTFYEVLEGDRVAFCRN